MQVAVNVCAAMVVPECPVKAADFDEKHSRPRRIVKNHAGARELADQYTAGSEYTRTPPDYVATPLIRFTVLSVVGHRCTAPTFGNRRNGTFEF